MDRTSNVYHAASSVAQYKKGRVQDLGRGSCSKSMSQSPRSVDPSKTTDISAVSPMENAPFGEMASQLSVYACGNTHQPDNPEGKQSQFSSPSLTQTMAVAQSLPLSESAGAISKQFAHTVPRTSGLTKTQKGNLRKRLKRAKAKANLSNVTGSGTQRPLSSSSTSSPCLKDLHPCSSAVNKTIKMAIVRESFPKTKLSAENSALIQHAILQQMDSELSDNLSLKIYSTTLNKGALILQCGDTATVNWIIKYFNGDRKILDGEALKVMSSKKLPKRKLCKVAFKIRTTFAIDSSILLRRLQRLNEGLITEHWRVLHVSSEPNSCRWIFEVEESDVDTIRGFNLRASSGLNYGFFKILFDPREKKKCEESKSPEDNFSEETAFRLSSSPELEDMYMVCSDSEEPRLRETQPSIPGLTLLHGND